MADATTPTPGSPDDVNVIKPPQGSTDPAAIARQLSDSYQSTLSSQVIQKQHRTVLAGLATITAPNTLDHLNLTPGAAYSQTEAQAIVDQVNALTQIAAQVNVILEFIQQLSSGTIVKPDV